MRPPLEAEEYGAAPVHLPTQITGSRRRRGRNRFPILIRGRRSTGDDYEARVCLPQAFPYALMKLFAFRDRKDDPDPRKAKAVTTPSTCTPSSP